MDTRRRLLLYCLLLELFTAGTIQAADQQPSTDGFISIDCGSTGDNTDSTTGLAYTTDEAYIHTGTNYMIKESYASRRGVSKLDVTLRSFPAGERNCYTLPAQNSGKYLIRTTFLHGDYDGQGLGGGGQLLFDLHIGLNRWMTVNISDVSNSYASEALAVAVTGSIDVCLVKTGSAVPFISSLGLRQLRDGLYRAVDSARSFGLLYRLNFGLTTEKIIRSPIPF